MLQIAAILPAGIERYFETTPPDQIFAHALFAIGWFPIAAVLFWGLTQMWLDYRQGLFAGSLRWHLLRVQVPADAVQTPKGMENFFSNIAGAKSSITWKEKWLDGKFQPWFSFEIVSIGGDIRMYIRTVEKYRDIVESALYAQYPEASIMEVDDYVDAIPEDYPNDDWELWGSEIKLSKNEILPIRSWEEFEHQGEKDQRFKDPLLPTLEGLGKMMPGENYAIQLMIMPPEDQDWTKEGIKMLNKALGKEEKKKSGSWFDSIAWIPGEITNQVTGGSLFGEGGETKSDADAWAAFRITPQEKEQLEGVTRKIGKLGWYTKIRMVYVAKKEIFRKGTIASMTKGFFHQYGHLNLNKFGLHDPATPKDDYFWQVWEMPAKQRRLAKRYKKRAFGDGSTPYVLNNEELATLFHFPAADARTPVLTSLASRRSEAPVELQFAGVDEPDLPNIDRVSPDVESQKKVVAPPKPLATPRPMAPTATSREAFPVSHAAPMPEVQEHMPQPGMPAPLPPGLDLSDEPIDAQETPRNLPM